MPSRLSSSYRMNRVLRPDRAAVIVPVDHGVVWGRVPSLESPAQVMRDFMGEDITGFMVTTGIVRSTEVEMAAKPALARVLAMNSFWPTGSPETGTGTIVAQVEDAVRLGVDCVKMLLPWNVADAEKIRYTERIGKVVAEANRWEIPTMIEPVLLAAERNEATLKTELEVARVAYDLGADIIKITFPGAEGTRMLVEELGIPIVVAGGALSGDATATVREVEEAITAGAQGMVVGRKVWQRPPEEAKSVLRDMISISRNAFTRHW